MTDTADAPDEFIKPRRNFVWFSLLIILFVYLGLEPSYNKGYEFLGLDFKIHNPDLFIIFIRIGFLYFFWNYYIACRNSHGLFNFYQAVYKIAEDITYKWALSRDTPDNSGSHHFGASRRQGISFSYTTRTQNKENQFLVFKPSLFRSLTYWLLAFLDVTFRTALFIRYILPYLLGIFALYLLFQKSFNLHNIFSDILNKL